MTEEVYVYIICHIEDNKECAPVKIGVAKKPHARVRELSTGNPKRLAVYDALCAPRRDIAYALEEAFHVTQNRKRLCGEWFDIDPPRAVALLGMALMSHLYHLGVDLEEAKEMFKYATNKWSENNG